MKTRLKRYEQVYGQWVKIQSEIVDFVEITGTQSAKVIDKNGKQRVVRRKNLLDVPNNVLYPDMVVVGMKTADHESWKRACYYD